MKYKAGYKYQLYDTERRNVRVYMPELIVEEYITLNPDGYMLIDKGYAWDGLSGPAFDTKTGMRGSLYHDALYQLMRKGKLSLTWQARADEVFHEICLEDGMWKPRAWWCYRAVRRLGHMSTAESAAKEVLIAP